MHKLSDEEVAYRVVSIYFENVARLGFKRQLDLDAVVNAYLYTLSRIQKKEVEMKSMEEVVKRLEEKLSKESKEELLP
jgi:hypothetical protein